MNKCLFFFIKDGITIYQAERDLAIIPAPGDKITMLTEAGSIIKGEIIHMDFVLDDRSTDCTAGDLIAFNIKVDLYTDNANWTDHYG